MKKYTIGLLLLAVGASSIMWASEPLDAVVNADNGDIITVEVTGGTAPYTVEVTDQFPQMGPGPVFLFTEIEDGAYEVKVTDESGNRFSEDVQV